MDPWDMILAHRYAEAVRCYEAELRTNPEDPGLLTEYATGLLNLGRLDEALVSFRRANELESSALAGESQPFLVDIGVTLWLLGKRGEAIETFRAAVDGILDGSIKFGDNAGGVSQGLLLWYAGLTARDETAKQDALKYLRKLARKPRIKHWPGHIALFVLGQGSQRDVLLQAAGKIALEEAVGQVKDNLLKRRDLVKALFYFAVQRRAEGVEEKCREGMIQCASLENPILEPEWYLARAEANAPAHA
jgi:tetratricopeptide (TPR) repeat protein